MVRIFAQRYVSHVREMRRPSDGRVLVGGGGGRVFGGGGGRVLVGGGGGGGGPERPPRCVSHACSRLNFLPYSIRRQAWPP